MSEQINICSKPDHLYKRYRCGICKKWLISVSGVGHRNVILCSPCYYANKSRLIVAELCKTCIDNLKKHIIQWDEYNTEENTECVYCRKNKKIYKYVMKDSVKMDIYKDILTIKEMI